MDYEEYLHMGESNKAECGRNWAIAIGLHSALIARTDIDFIALDKGEITPRKAVDALVDKMEGYANFGFDYIKEKMEDAPNYFFKEMSFLRTFTSSLRQTKPMRQRMTMNPNRWTKDFLSKRLTNPHMLIFAIISLKYK